LVQEEPVSAKARSAKSQLALFGGPKAVRSKPRDLFRWPIITDEDRRAVLEVLNRGAMSRLDVTKAFEAEFAKWQGTRYALGHNTGTAALEGAMFGCGVGRGDEIICPSVTYWASAMPCYNLGATVVFCEIDPATLCVAPGDVEHRISKRTKAILVVHYLGYPCDMDPIMEIAARHKLFVIEDVSHAQGGLYKGRKLGTIGDVGAMSLMSEKSFPIGEGGILVTDNRRIYERAVAWGHYERFQNPANFQTAWLKRLAGLPLGGHKYRMHQLSSAVGRVQLRHYDKRRAEIQKAFNYFWDLLEGVPGLRASRTDPKDPRTTMGGWYCAHGRYVPEELGGLSVTRFAETVQAEGSSCNAGSNRPLHLHPVFTTADIYGDGKPTRIAFSDRDLRQRPGSLPVSEAVNLRWFSIPWFKRFRPKLIKEHATAFRKVAENYRELLTGDRGNPPLLGGWHFARHH
jgi:dTDP-4-amino-4,6-dideoxygalactose transaminase